MYNQSAMYEDSIAYTDAGGQLCLMQDTWVDWTEVSTNALSSTVVTHCVTLPGMIALSDPPVLPVQLPVQFK